VKPRGKTSASKLPFDLSERTVIVPPLATHDVQISFCPMVGHHFSAAFEAVVRGAMNNPAKCLRFGIEGAGTMPVISIPKTNLTRNRQLNYSFGKTLVSASRERSILIQNPGTIPVVLTMTPSPSPDFELVDADVIHETVVRPNSQLVITVRYSPVAVRAATFAVAIAVQDNAAMNLQLNFSGEGFSEDFIFEGLPSNDNDIIFRDVVVGRPCRLCFAMRNICQSPARFVWTNVPGVTFAPRIGHLHVGASKEITATFFTDKPCKVNALKVACQISKIKLKDELAPDWDDGMRLVRFVERSVLSPPPAPHAPGEDRPKGASRRLAVTVSTPKANARTANAPPTDPPFQKAESTTVLAYGSPRGAQFDVMKVIDVKEEPAIEVLPGQTKEFPLRVFAVADYIQYQAAVSEIEFSPTMMFETRIVEFKITNPSQIRFEYTWVTKQFGSLRTSYALFHASPFAISPSSGYIEAGQTTTFRATFAPQEVDDFSAHFRCDISFLDQMDPPHLYVSGRSRRPICHFNLKPSD
jgi:hydrocephalus-inducing protein